MLQLNISVTGVTDDFTHVRCYSQLAVLQKDFTHVNGRLILGSAVLHHVLQSSLSVTENCIYVTGSMNQKEKVSCLL